MDRTQELEIQVAALNADLNRRSQECFEKQVTIETLTREVRRLNSENERLTAPKEENDQ